MAERTGLAADSPTLVWCEKMDAVPELRAAFKNSMAVFYREPSLVDPILWLRSNVCAEIVVCAAPTRGEMLEWLKDDDKGDVRLEEDNWTVYIFDGVDHYDITDPDALAQACLAAVGRRG